MKIKKKYINTDKIKAKIIQDEKFLKGLRKLIQSDNFSEHQISSFGDKVIKCKERIKKLKKKL